MAHVKVQEAFSDVSNSDLESDLDDEEDTTDKEVEEDVPHAQEKPSGGGLAEVMAAILTKTVPKGKIILAKGQTDKEIKIRKRKRDIEEGKVKEDEGDSDFERKTERMLKRKAWNNMNRVKPHPLDREKERRLQRITTRGVVLLFNAVQKQRKDLDEGLAEAGSSTRKTERVLGSFTKDKFLDLLKGKASTSKQRQTTKNEEESKHESWKILRDDFMMGAKMKDWDKTESAESASDEGQDEMDLSDSD